MEPFTLSQWESSVSSYPYYRLKTSTREKVLPTSILPKPATYVVETKEDISDIGYEYLYDMVSLEAPVMGIIDRLDIYHPNIKHSEMEGWAIDEACYFFTKNAPTIFTYRTEGRRTRNRLFATLTTREACLLMAQWTFNVFHGRCKKFAVIFDKDNPAGFIGISKTLFGADNIDLIAVHPDYRGKGYGKDLVNWSRIYSGYTNGVSVRTESPNLSALKMYKDCGFVEVDRTPLWWYRCF